MALTLKSRPSLEPVVEVVEIAEDCVRTYGPLPLDPPPEGKEGWVAWGVICPPGVEP